MRRGAVKGPPLARVLAQMEGRDDGEEEAVAHLRACKDQKKIDAYQAGRAGTRTRARTHTRTRTHTRRNLPERACV